MVQPVRPLMPGMSADGVARLALGEKWDGAHLAQLREQKERVDEEELGLIFGESAKRLRESGWGVIFPHGVSDEIRHSLAPLMKHREAQANRDHEGLYRELVYLPGESKPKFLARYKVGPGPVDPFQLPYYLLIVGGPEAIPFSFQYQLDVQYAVGRLHFDDLEGYGNYARGVHRCRARQGPAVVKDGACGDSQSGRQGDRQE